MHVMHAFGIKYLEHGREATYSMKNTLLSSYLRFRLVDMDFTFDGVESPLMEISNSSTLHMSTLCKRLLHFTSALLKNLALNRVLSFLILVLKFIH